MEQQDFFPKEAEMVKKEKEKRKKWLVNPGEIKRRRAKEDMKKLVRHSVETVGRLVDNAEKKYNKINQQPTTNN